MRRPIFYNSVPPTPAVQAGAEEVPYGPDATSAIGQTINNPKNFHILQGVPVFKMHQREDPNTKKLISVDLAKLNRIAANMVKMEQQGGVPIRMTIGHTEPGKPEIQQPPLAGFYRNARVQRFGPSGEPAIVVDEWLDPKYLPLRKNYPYRSSEYYDDTEQITGVALLSRDPFLDLGIVAYSQGRTPTLYGKPWMPDAGTLSYTGEVPGSRQRVDYARSHGQRIPTMYRLIQGDVLMNPNQQWAGPVVPPQYPDYQYGQSIPPGYGEYPAEPVPYPVQYGNGQSIPTDYGRYRPTAYWDGTQARGGNSPQMIPHTHTNTGAVYADPGGMPQARPLGSGEQMGRKVGGMGGGVVGAGVGGYMGGPVGGLAGRAAGSRLGSEAGGYVGRMADNRMGGGKKPTPNARYSNYGTIGSMGGAAAGGLGGAALGGMVGGPIGAVAGGALGSAAGAGAGSQLGRYGRSGRRGRGAPGYYDDEADYDDEGPPPGMDQGGGGMGGGPEPEQMPPGMGGGMPEEPMPQNPNGNVMEEVYQLVSQLQQLLGQSLGECGPGGPPGNPMPPNTPFPGGPAPMNSSRYGRAPQQRGRNNYATPRNPMQYNRPQPTRMARTLTGLPVGYQLELDKRDAEIRRLSDTMNVVMYERDQADTQACYAEIGKLAQAGFDVGEYEVAELKRRNAEERAYYLQTIATKYSRIGTEPLPPMMGDPSPHHMQAQQPGNLTKEQMNQVLSLVGNQPDPNGARYAQAVEAVRYGRVAPQGPFGNGSVFNNPDPLEGPVNIPQNRLQPSQNGHY